MKTSNLMLFLSCLIDFNSFNHKIQPETEKALKEERKGGKRKKKRHFVYVEGGKFVKWGGAEE